MSTTSGIPLDLTDVAMDLPGQPTDPGGALADAGSDFGTLMLGVGNAVAATQQKLTENSAETTSKLANALVDVIAVQRTGYDDNGVLRNAEPFKQKMPLITFVEPVYYEFPKVRLQARFQIDEFAAASSSTGSSSGQSFGVGVGLSLQKKAFSIGVAGGFNSGSQSTSVSAQNADSSAVGQIRMFAQLTPREDVGIPKPLRVIVGPSIAILAGATTSGVGADGIPYRALSVLIQVRDKAGNPIPDKAISIDAEGTLWSFVPEGAKTTGAKDTPDAGNITIQLTRPFPEPPPGAPPVDTAPKPIVVTAVLGSVSNRTTVTL